MLFRVTWHISENYAAWSVQNDIRISICILVFCTVGRSSPPPRNEGLGRTGLPRSYLLTATDGLDSRKSRLVKQLCACAAHSLTHPICPVTFRKDYWLIRHNWYNCCGINITGAIHYQLIKQMVDVVYTVGLEVDCNHLDIKLIQRRLAILKL